MPRMLQTEQLPPGAHTIRRVSSSSRAPEAAGEEGRGHSVKANNATGAKEIHSTLEKEQDKADRLESARVPPWLCFLSRAPKLPHQPWVAPAQEHLGTGHCACPVPALQEGCRGTAPGQVPSFLQLLLG